MNSVSLIRCLGIVSLLSGVLIVGVKLLTEDRIRENQAVVLQDSIRLLLPGAVKQVAFRVGTGGKVEIEDPPASGGEHIYAGYDAQGKLLGVVLEASERGYADMISALYAYQPRQRLVTGFSVVEMKETPGLGDRISTDPEFLENFRNLESSKPITTVKHGSKRNPWEIDAISGATISSRAVGRMLQKGVEKMDPILQQNLPLIERGKP